MRWSICELRRAWPLFGVLVALSMGGCLGVPAFDTGDLGEVDVAADAADGGEDDAQPDTRDPDTTGDAGDTADAADAADVAEVIEAPVGEPGETCLEAGAIDPAGLPWSGIGTTAGARDDYAPGACPGAPQSEDGAGDVAYRFTPLASGVYTFALPDAGPLRPGPAIVSVVTACDGAAPSCVGVSPDLVLGGVLRVALEAGTTYFVLVDGLYAGDAGPYALTVSAPCAPACAADCGPDGCGGSCGACGGALACAQGGQCATAETLAGNSCAVPFEIATVPYAHEDDTGYGSDTVAFAAGTCGGFAADEAVGGGWNDHVFHFVPETTATYVVRLAAAFDAALAVEGACGATDGGGACLGASDRPGLGVEEQVAVRLSAGHDAWFVVDGGGRAAAGSGAGAYALSVSAPCFPDCTGKICGDDGCFGSCGVCFPTEVCQEPFGLCDVVTGNTCDDPLEVNAAALPFGSAGNTAVDAGDVFAWSGGVCPDGAPSGGGGAHDQVWHFTAPTRGVYTARVVPGFDAVLTALAGGCDSEESGCVAVSDVSGSGGAEEVVLDLAAGEERWLVVDGYAGSGAASGPYSLSVSAPCVPACDGRACGSSGCGTSCGACPTGAVCSATGQCEQPVGSGCEAPFVVDAAALPFVWQGSTASGAAATFATSLDCGPNGTVAGEDARDQVFVLTPVTSGVYTVRLEAAFDGMLSVRAGCDAGETACLAVEAALGEDEVLRVALDAGVAYAIVVDGFSAGAHGAYTLTVSAPCTPSCNERACGEDGCGLTCGSCPAPAACAPAGACVAPQTLAGNLCTTAFETGPAPFVGAGNTVYASDAHALPAGSCGATFPALGEGSADQVWRFVAPATGSYRVTLDASFLAALYAVSGCDEAEASLGACLGVAAGETHEELVLPLAAGEEARLVVDGLGAAVGGQGAYTLRIGAACTPSCGGRACGGDGCGGSCGACEAGRACDDLGQCVAPAEVLGDVCANPWVIDAVPAQMTGATTGRSGDYAFPAGACPGVAGGWGGASADAVYRLDPPAAGTYTVRVTPDFDAVVYAVRDCGAIATSCLGGADVIGVAPETLTLALADTAPVYLIVDGFSNEGDVSGSFVLEVTGP